LFPIDCIGPSPDPNLFFATVNGHRIIRLKEPYHLSTVNSLVITQL
jgi:hypothetical protein